MIITNTNQVIDSANITFMDMGQVADPFQRQKLMVHLIVGVVTVMLCQTPVVIMFGM